MRGSYFEYREIRTHSFRSVPGREARRRRSLWDAGIDWADQHHDVFVIDEAGRQVGSLRVAHTKAGLKELTRFLLGLAHTAEQMACIIETTQGLLMVALLDAGFPVYPVNPKTVDRRRNPAGAKTDQIDAYVLAKKGRSDLLDLRRLHPESPVVQELKVLTRDQDALIEMPTRLVNQLTACLKASYPVALSLLATVAHRSTLVFLQTYPTPQAARAASIPALSAPLKQAGHPTATKVAPQIWQTRNPPQLEADAVTTRAKARLMLAQVAPTAAGGGADCRL